jgi:hypothetical protein
MFIGIETSQYINSNVVFSDKNPNNIMDNGYFYRILYSDTFYKSTGLIVYFEFNTVSIENYFNKIKCYINKENNKIIIKELVDIEKSLINTFAKNQSITLKPSYILSKQLNNDFIKIFSEKHQEIGRRKNIKLILKISGIWTNLTEFGITFRFYIV